VALQLHQKTVVELGGKIVARDLCRVAAVLGAKIYEVEKRDAFGRLFVIESLAE
jgi:hypothetical protein